MSQRLAQSLLVLVVTTALTAAATAAQRTIRVTGDAPQTLTAQRVLTIGSEDGPNEVMDVGSFSRDSQGRIFVVFTKIPYEIRVFSATGQLVKRMGRSGAGPGEYRFIFGLEHGPGDTLFIFDNSLDRITVLSPSGQLVKTTRLATPSLGSTPLYVGNGRFISHSRISSRERAGFPLHIINLDGEIERSFGADPPIVRRDQPNLGRRRLGPGTNGVWAGHWARYRIEQWNRDGKLMTVVDRNVDWFKPYEDAPRIARSRDTPPPPWFRSVSEDSLGRLWVAVRVPAENWKEALGRERVGPQGLPVVPVINWSKYENTMIEVIDLRSGNVLGSTRAIPGFVNFFRPGQALAYREDSNGVPFLDIWQLDIPSTPARRLQ